MEQKIYEHHFEVESTGSLKGINLDDLIREAEKEGFTVKQISTCSSCQTYVNQDSLTFVHVFLLAEKEE